MECVWLEYYYDDENPKEKLMEAWRNYRRDGYVELDSDHRIVSSIGIDFEGTRFHAMQALLKDIYSAIRDGSITDPRSSLSCDIQSLLNATDQD